MYVQAISAYAPHPNAAKLWMEYLYCDEGQTHLAEGLLQPDPLRRIGQGGDGPDASCPAKLPDIAGAVLPTLDQITTATDVITKGWAIHRRRDRQVASDRLRRRSADR